MRYPRAPMGRRLALELWFAAHSLVVVWRLRKQLDRVIAIFPPSLFFYLLRWVLPHGVRRIGIVHDLQGMLGLSGERLVTRWFGRLVRHVETKGFQSCDRLVLLSKAMMGHVVNAYGIDQSRCIVCYPFVTEPEESGDGETLAALFDHGFSHVVYSGALGDKQHPFGLLDLFERLASDRPDVVCHIFSRGPIFDQLRSQCDASLKIRIRFHDLVDERDLPELYVRSTIQVIPQKSGTSAGAFPSKLPNLLAAGVPVFAITDQGSELAALLSQSVIGRHCTSWNHDLVLPTLCSFIDEVSKLSRETTKGVASDIVTKHFLVGRTVDSL